MSGATLNLRLRSEERPEQIAKELLLSPLIYIRLLGIVCSIVVFGCISDKVQEPHLRDGSQHEECGYNGSDACGFAIAVGVIGFLLCLVFLLKDVAYVIIDYSENPVVKRVLVIIDAGVNGLWGLMWFVCFCYTADQWRRVDGENNFDTATVNCARSGVAFSFFCILIWVAIVVVNVILLIRFIRGSDSSIRPGGGYASFPEGPSEQPYQGEDKYSPPEY